MTKPLYDPLDGTGSTGVRIEVMNWVGNVELHISPKGLLRDLALKLDMDQDDYPVLVVGYKFSKEPKPVIQRIRLENELKTGFKVFRSNSAENSSSDEIIISNNSLVDEEITEIPFDPEPIAMFPAPAPEQKKARKRTLAKNHKEKKNKNSASNRVPASSLPAEPEPPIVSELPTVDADDAHTILTNTP